MKINLFTSFRITQLLVETQAIQKYKGQGGNALQSIVARDNMGTCYIGSSSEKEHKVNALASGAEEGRDKLR